LRPYWYGEYTDNNGKRKVDNLGKWHGIPPPALTGKGDQTTGDAVFEKSREDAETVLKLRAEDARHKGRAEHLVERLIEAKTGHAVEHARIVELADRWLSMPRASDLTAAHASGVRSACERFKVFMARRNSAAAMLYEVTTSDAGAFAELLRREYAPRTARGYTALLRSAFRRFLPAGVANPFAGIVTGKGRDTVGDSMIHRKPFTPDELQKLVLAANGDKLMGGLITAAACTGMRRGDVCGLRWADVDFVAGMIDVRTSKTGATVEIPLFSPLRTVLKERTGNGSELVFPEAARMLEENPDGLTWRFKKVVAHAFTDVTAPLPETVKAEDIEVDGMAAIAARLPAGSRRDRTLDTFRRYCAGESFRQIRNATGCPKGTISYDLHAVEVLIGKPFVRSGQGPGVKVAIARLTRTERSRGKRSASVRDWHALRTTFCTLALSAGVPIELVRRVTGHATLDVVLRHYFRPDRAQFKAALVKAMPTVLTGKPVKLKPAEEMAVLVGKIGDGSATAADKKRLRKLAAAA